MKALLFLLLLCIALPPALAHAASFDCTKASTSVERQICADPVLSTMDELLAKSYSKSLESGERNALAVSQKAWLSKRNSCQDQGCLQQAYEERINELNCEDTGGAAGALQCHSSRLQLAECILDPLEKQYAQKVREASNNPEYASRVLAEEALAWRQYRAARCALYGEGEGGADEWKNAWAVDCEVEETTARIDALRGQTGGKDK